MIRRITAAATVLPVLLALFAVMHDTKASAETPPPSLVILNDYRKTSGAPNISTPGSPVTYMLEIEFPATGFTLEQLRNLEIRLGADFLFSSGSDVIRPYLEATALPDNGKGEIPISLVYIGPGNFLEVTLSHPTMPVSDTASSTWRFYVRDTVEPPPAGDPGLPYEPSAPDPPPGPDYGATPRFAMSGSIPTVEAGKRENIRFTVTNTSTHVANNVIVIIQEGTNELFRPTTVLGNSVAIGTIRPGSGNAVNVSIPVEVFANAQEGYYIIPLQFTMTNSAGVAIDQSSSVQVFIRNPNSGEFAGKPSVTLASASVDRNIPGSDGLITLTLDIANIGDGSASDVRVSLTGFKSTEITLNESVVTKSLGNIASGSRSEAIYSLRVASGLESGSYPLDVEVRYRQPDGTEGTMSDVAYVNIIRPAGGASGAVQLVGVSQNVSNPGSSNVIRVTLTVENKDSTTAQDVTLSLDGLSSSGFTLSNSFGDMTIGNIAPGETASATVPLHVSQSLPNGNYPLTTILRHTNAGTGGALLTSEMEIYIFVNRPESNTPDDLVGPSSVPRVIISRHAISTDTVNAGSPFELTFTLLNTSSTVNVSNMQVTITDTNGIFIPVAGVNSFYIAELPIGQTTDITIALMPKQDAESRSHPLTITLDYEDQKYNPHTVVSALNIPVYMPQRLEITNVSFYDNGMGSAELSFMYVNKGRATLENLNIRIEGPMMAMEGDFFHGLLSPGQYDFFEDMVFPFEYGELEGFIVLEFEDSSGAPHELREPLYIYMSEPYWPDDGFDNGRWPFEDEWIDGDGLEEDAEGMPGWLLWAIIGGAALIVVIIIIIIIKRKRRKKLELLDDEYEAQITAEMQKNNPAALFTAPIAPVAPVAPAVPFAYSAPVTQPAHQTRSAGADYRAIADPNNYNDNAQAIADLGKIEDENMIMTDMSIFSDSPQNNAGLQAGDNNTDVKAE